jgi:hypothetical protein
MTLIKFFNIKITQQRHYSHVINIRKEVTNDKWQLKEAGEETGGA